MGILSVCPDTVQGSAGASVGTAAGTWVQILTPPLNSFVTLGKSLIFYEHQFPPLQNTDNDLYYFNVRINWNKVGEKVLCKLESTICVRMHCDYSCTSAQEAFLLVENIQF